MIDVNKLKGEMVANGYNQRELARKLGITSKTLSIKLKKGIFNSDEMDTLIKVLKIDDPVEIFFANDVTQEETQ